MNIIGYINTRKNLIISGKCFIHQECCRNHHVWSKYWQCILTELSQKHKNYFWGARDLRKQNQPGIKFYNIECVEFISRTFFYRDITKFEVSSFSTFSNFCPIVISYSLLYRHSVHSLETEWQHYLCAYKYNLYPEHHLVFSLRE